MKLNNLPFLSVIVVALIVLACGRVGDNAEINDSTTPLHLLQPDYATHYGQLSPDTVKADLDRVFEYIDRVTPAVMTGGIVNLGTYRLTSYEWAVLYNALLDASVITGDNRYSYYVRDRISFLATVADNSDGDVSVDGQLRQVVNPLTLDDAGAMSGAWMRAAMTDSKLNISKYIEQYWDVVLNAPVRLTDGTIARHRPHYNTVWLDDMYMILPAMAIRAEYTKQPELIDSAAEIASGFMSRMWIPEKKLYRHGYVEGLEQQPSFAWARANGWAMLAISQLLDYMPLDHKSRPILMEQFCNQASGLLQYQGINGFWHQLLDRPETFEETSATAIFAYTLAHGVNKGWLSPEVFAPVAQLAWEAVASKINSRGEVEDVVVGTGMGFDPAFYAHRPVSVKAAHGYGPVIWAAAEIITMLKNSYSYLNDNAVHYYSADPEPQSPLFSLDENGKAVEIRH